MLKNHTEKELWTLFSNYIRTRDADWRGYAKCISCSTVKQWKEFDCGHYIPKGSDYALKFDEINNNAQCRACNYFKSGNLIEYRKGLVSKCGEKMVKKLELSHEFKTTKKKLNQFEINVMYKDYQDKLKRLELTTPYHVK